MNLRYSTLLKGTLLFLAIAVLSSRRASAQSSLQVKSSRNKTTITVTNFPKNATVLIVDDNLNLVCTAATNEAGFAVVKLDKGIKAPLTARTVHGDYEASSKQKGPVTPVKEGIATGKTGKPVKA